MLSSSFMTCFFLRVFFFYSLVRAQIRFDTLRDHWLFLGVLFTAATAFLNYVFIQSAGATEWPPLQLQIARNFGVTPWQAYLAETFLLTTLYFWLMAKFDEGVIFWTLLLLGVPLVFLF
ncbi:MAG: hypothetical protein ACYC61_07505 [Isosphaeraceae bacterium]